MAAPRRRTGNPDHQQPYPLTLHDHVRRAVEAHLALTTPPEDDYAEADEVDERGDDEYAA